MRPWREALPGPVPPARVPITTAGDRTGMLRAGLGARNAAEYLRLSALGRRQGIRHGLPCSGVAVIAWEASESGYPRRIAGVVTRSWPGRGVSARTAPGDMAWWLGSGVHGPAGCRLPEFSRPGGRARVRLMGDCRASGALAEAGVGRSMGIWLLDNGAIRVMMASTRSEAHNPPSRTLPFSATMAPAVFGARRPG